MKAEVTAENRPACDPSQYVYIHATCKAHKYQCCVQIFIIPLVEFLVILLSQLAVIFIELKANVLRSWAHILSLTIGEVLVVLRRDVEQDLLISWFPILYHNLLLQLSRKVLAAVRCQPNMVSWIEY